MKQNYLIIISFVAFIVFLLISYQSIYGNGLVYDDILIAWIQTNHLPYFTEIMRVVTAVGSGEMILIITFVIVFLLLVKKNVFTSIFLLSITIGGIFINFVLKVLFQRERPGEGRELEVFNYSLEIPSYSFPSGHTMRSVILFSFLIYLIYQVINHYSIKILLSILCGIMIILIAQSRVYLGLHYPSDIISAISISISWFFVCLYFFRKFKPKRKVGFTFQ
ncbi:phosphatase PAP2 family protein [Bacillus sp. FJAT-45350]|uniref:phosphatase PAP2 family protein n=1 Tax=Bacillus sp. FJAT-45350 TaxID=2011014 RepID=UPI000BB685CC|nr:phosphatase PAP2 family protein [Bacillus sp. FJAT-45350]